jgi:hypothetical protein
MSVLFIGKVNHGFLKGFRLLIHLCALFCDLSRDTVHPRERLLVFCP